MSLSPTDSERLARARSDLRIGLPVVLRGKEGVALVLAAEALTTDRLRDLRQFGEPVLAITDWRARTLKARPYDGDLSRVRIPEDADPAWVRAVTDPATDLDHPMKGPFREVRDGPADLHRLAIRIAKSAHLLPAAVVVTGADEMSMPDGVTVIDAAAALARLDEAGEFDEVVSGRVPMGLAGVGRVRVFRPRDGGEEHYAIEIGTPDRAGPVLVRLHSACFTGDVLGSLKCDCGPQLKSALATMGEAGSGLLLYLNQEGRGIGLANKLRAYALQDQGFDTVEANHRLGFEDDERDFRIGAGLLRKLGIGRIRLMTNNPAKVSMMEDCGVDVVDRVPLAVGRNPMNEGYLDTKARKSGHLL